MNKIILILVFIATYGGLALLFWSVFIGKVKKEAKKRGVIYYMNSKKTA